MPEHLLLISPPVSCTGRNFYPLIRVFCLVSQPGIWLSVTPVALIIEEGGEWSFTALEEGVGEEIVRDATPICDINET